MDFFEVKLLLLVVYILIVWGLWVVFFLYLKKLYIEKDGVTYWRFLIKELVIIFLLILLVQAVKHYYNLSVFNRYTSSLIVVWIWRFWNYLRSRIMNTANTYNKLRVYFGVGIFFIFLLCSSFVLIFLLNETFWRARTQTIMQFVLASI